MSGTPSSEVRAQLARLLDEGVTGCLRAQVAGGEICVFLMDGSVIAARSPQDDSQLLRMLVLGGVIDGARAADVRNSGVPLVEQVWSLTDEATADALVEGRFQACLAAMLEAQPPLSFEPMDAIFEPNLQLGHDTRGLIAELELGLRKTAPLRTPGGLACFLDRGPKSARNEREQALLDLIAPGTTISSLLRRFPEEELSTLDLMVDMLDAGSLITTAEDTTEDPESSDEPLLDDPSVLGSDAPTEAEGGPSTPAQGRTELKGLSKSGFLAGPDHAVAEDELAMFADNDEYRGTAHKADFTKGRKQLEDERIDLTGAEPPAAPAPADALEADGEADEGGEVKVNFGGPRLSNADALRKIETANEALRALSAALDETLGNGNGQLQVQTLVEGTSSEFNVLFHKVKIDADGSVNPAAVLANLRKRPPTEHRRLLNRGLGDLLERAMNYGADTLDPDLVDEFIERVMGCMSRLGI